MFPFSDEAGKIAVYITKSFSLYPPWRVSKQEMTACRSLNITQCGDLFQCQYNTIEEECSMNQLEAVRFEMSYKKFGKTTTKKNRTAFV